VASKVCCGSWPCQGVVWFHVVPPHHMLCRGCISDSADVASTNRFRCTPGFTAITLFAVRRMMFSALPVHIDLRSVCGRGGREWPAVAPVVAPYTEAAALLQRMLAPSRRASMLGVMVGSSVSSSNTAKQPQHDHQACCSVMLLHTGQHRPAGTWGEQSTAHYAVLPPGQPQAWWCRQQRPSWCGRSCHICTVPLRYIGAKRRRLCGPCEGAHRRWAQPTCWLTTLVACGVSRPASAGHVSSPHGQARRCCVTCDVLRWPVVEKTVCWCGQGTQHQLLQAQQCAQNSHEAIAGNNVQVMANSGAVGQRHQ
jgi:hypothetical protein